MTSKHYRIYNELKLIRMVREKIGKDKWANGNSLMKKCIVCFNFHDKNNT